MTTYPTTGMPIPLEERLILKARFPEEEDCALCLQSMKGALVIRLPCGHHYHEKCHARLRDAAASYRYRCPSCRSDVKAQIQRLKVYELWGDDLWDQYQCYVRSLDGGPPPWEKHSGKRKMEAFERWVLEGLSDGEVSELFDADNPEPNAQADHSLQSPEVPPGSPISSDDLGGYLDETLGLGVSADNSDEYWEQYFASLTLATESDEDESQPDSP